MTDLFYTLKNSADDMVLSNIDQKTLYSKIIKHYGTEDIHTLEKQIRKTLLSIAEFRRILKTMKISKYDFYRITCMLSSKIYNKRVITYIKKYHKNEK